MWWRNCKRLSGVIGLLLVAATATAKVVPGQAMPALADLQLEGTLPDLRGRVVLIDVWASWCAPCKSSCPALSALQTEFAREGLVVLGVSVDRKARDFEQFVRRYAPTFATVRDGATRFATTFAPSAMPTTYLVDRQGVVREVHAGFHGARTVEAWRAAVRQLLEEKP